MPVTVTATLAACAAAQLWLLLRPAQARHATAAFTAALGVLAVLFIPSQGDAAPLWAAMFLLVLVVRVSTTWAATAARTDLADADHAEAQAPSTSSMASA